MGDLVSMALRAVVLILALNILCYSRPLRVYFLNIGEGDSIVVVTPSEEIYVIDTGNFVTGLKVVRFLKKKGWSRISKLIITHHHLDHIGGIFYILQMLRVNERCDNGEKLRFSGLCGDIYRWYSKIFRENKWYITLRAGDWWESGGVKFKVLWPRKLTGNFNRDSIVIKVSYGDCSFLLMGDADKIVERDLVTIYGNTLKSTVLKIGHHGSKDATSKAFLKIVSPEYAVISVDRENIREYPSKEVIDLLKNFGVKTFITFRDGDVEFSCESGKKLWVNHPVCKTEFLNNLIK